VVIVIIMILVAGIITVGASVRKKAKINETKSLINNLASALREYKNFYEATFNNFSANIEVLDQVPNCRKILSDIPTDKKADTDSNQIVDTIYDSWGYAIRVELKGAGNFPTIRSRGPDETFNTADDITSDTL